MAINVYDASARAQLAKAIRYSFEQMADERNRRKNLIRIFRGDSILSELLQDDTRRDETLVNYFQAYLRGHLVSVAAQLPSWQVKARQKNAIGFDKRIQLMLGRYSEILNLNNVFRQCAQDSVFGRAVVKVVTSIAPKGITSPVAPRAFRIDPNNLIVDQSSASFPEAGFICDVYLVPLNEAQNHQPFHPIRRMELERYSITTNSSWFGNNSDDLRSSDVFAEPMTRLIDVYIPSLGKLFTWPANTDSFHDIASAEPFGEIDIPINPYEEVSFLYDPASIKSLAPLNSLKGLHLLANDMYHKAAVQARNSQRNPISEMGDEDDLANILGTPDGEGAALNNPKSLDLFAIPGPDSTVIQMGNIAGGLFSQFGGNLEVALGHSAGADTARQTLSLIGQIQSVQAMDRMTFEIFMSNVGKKLASLAFEDEALELEILQNVPGTRYYYNAGWAPAYKLPRVADINAFDFSVVGNSSMLRTPAERIQQLQAASQILMQWLIAASQGVPANVGAIAEDLEEAFDLVGNLQKWFSGGQAAPQERSSNTYTSLAQPAQGSDIRYQSNSGLAQGGGGEMSAGAPVGMVGRTEG